MATYTIPMFVPKHDGSGFTKVAFPVWIREQVGDIGNDMLFASFNAFPTNHGTRILLELFDGEDYRPHAVVEIRTGLLISANDSGYNSLFNVVLAHIKGAGVNPIPF